MKWSLFLFVLGSVRATNSDQDDWELFKSKFGKSYEDESVENERKQIYWRNKAAVDEHNAKYAAGLTTFQMAVNQFGDMEPAEVKSIYYGYRQTNLTQARRSVSRVKSTQIPTSLDWRDKGAVTAVKDQGSCGGCWAFSATGSIEGQVFLASNELISLSEQELIDCSDFEGNLGCNGGNMDYAFEYVMANGLTTEACYPYNGKDGTCSRVNECFEAELSSYMDLPFGDENALLEAVATVGPISVAIDAEASFQYYAGGIYDEESCSSTDLNHGVLLIGYGTYNNTPYWIVKNSWGTSWGESGYILMSRNKSNQCGIASMASYPIVKSDAGRLAISYFACVSIAVSFLLM